MPTMPTIPTIPTMPTMPTMPTIPTIPTLDRVAEPPRDTVVIITSDSRLAIEYCPTEAADVYRFSQFRAFAPYISNVLTRQNGDAKVVIVLESILSLLDILHGLVAITTKKEIYDAKFLEAYRYYINQINPTANTATMIPTRGENDRPVSFDLVIIIDLASLGSTHMSRESIMIQQVVRFIALKHGGLIIITPHLDRILAHPDRIGSSSLDPQPHFVQPKQVSSLKAFICAYIPLGWDLWSRISILSKAGAHLKLWDSPEMISKVNDAYNEYLYSDKADPSAIMGMISLGSSESTMPSPVQVAEEDSLNDILRKVVSGK